MLLFHIFWKNKKGIAVRLLYTRFIQQSVLRLRVAEKKKNPLYDICSAFFIFSCTIVQRTRRHRLCDELDIDEIGWIKRGNIDVVVPNVRATVRTLARTR